MTTTPVGGARRDQGTDSNGASAVEYSQRKKQLKMKLVENKGFFADHCKQFDDSHRVGFAFW